MSTSTSAPRPVRQPSIVVEVRYDNDVSGAAKALLALLTPKATKSGEVR